MTSGSAVGSTVFLPVWVEVKVIMLTNRWIAGPGTVNLSPRDKLRLSGPPLPV